MAEMKTFNTRIKLRIDTLEAWNASTAKLMPGEVAFATIAASAGTGLEEPVIMAKIGTPDENGEDQTFSQLPWAFHAKASDVLAACKSEEALTSFINGVIADAGIASDDAMQELAGKVNTAEGKITTLEGKMTTAEGKISANEGAIATLQGLVGDEKVVDRINSAISALKLSETYEVKGEAAKVQSALDTYKNTTDAKILEHTNAISGNTNAISAIKDGESIDSFADVEAALATKEAAGEAAKAEAAAKAYADGLAGNYDAKGSAAAAQAAAEAYADGLAGNYDAVGSASAAEAAAKKYTDDEIKEWVGDSTVGAQIEALKLPEKYDAKGAAAAAESAAKSHATSLNTAMNTRVAALEETDHTHSFVEEELNKIAAGDVAKWNAAEQNAKTYADGLNTAMDARVDELEAMFGDGEGTVEAQIEAAVAAEAGLREAADTGLSNRIKAVEDDYLKAADKNELAGDIADVAALIGDGGTVPAQIEAAVADEAAIARAAEKANADAIKAIKDDYLKASDKTELTGAIATAKQEAIEAVLDGVTDDFDTLKEVAAWIASDTTASAELVTRVSDIEADYLKAADKTELAGKIKTAQDAADAAQGEVDALEGVVATKAAASDVTALAGRVTTAEGEIDTLQSEMDTAEGKITALETKVGDEKVVDRINSAIEALKIGDYAKAADLTAAVARIAQNEADIDALEGRMDTAEEDIIALEEEIATKANDADLAAIAKSGNVNDLIQTAGDVIVFDCGGAQ